MCINDDGELFKPAKLNISKIKSLQIFIPYSQKYWGLLHFGGMDRNWRFKKVAG